MAEFELKQRPRSLIRRLAEERKAIKELAKERQEPLNAIDKLALIERLYRK